MAKVTNQTDRRVSVTLTDGKRHSLEANQADVELAIADTPANRAKVFAGLLRIGDRPARTKEAAKALTGVSTTRSAPAAAPAAAPARTPNARPA